MRCRDIKTADPNFQIDIENNTWLSVWEHADAKLHLINKNYHNNNISQSFSACNRDNKL